MHPIYAAFIKRNIANIILMTVMLVIGISALFYGISLLMCDDDFGIIFIISSVFITPGSADILRRKILTSRKQLKHFLSILTPEQNARLLAEFRPNPSGEVIAGDFLILFGKQMEFICADTLSISSVGGRTNVSGCDIDERYDEWFIDDEDVIRQLRRLIHDRRRSVVCAGGRH